MTGPSPAGYTSSAGSDIIRIMEAPLSPSLLSRWAEMIKLAHSVFALPFALLATFLAARSAYLVGDARRPWPALGQFLLILLCMVAARSAAMTFNRIADARIDAANPRTAGRAIPAGTISPRQAWTFLLAGCGLFVLGCVGFWWGYANPWPALLSLPVLAYLLFYSYTKRFTRWSHFVLGTALALSPPAAWLAIHPASIGWPAVILAGIVTLWVAGFDIIYACQDLAFDRDSGLFSLPSRLGPHGALWVTRVAHAGAAGLLFGLAPVARLGWLYLLAATAATLLLVIENALVRPNDFSRINVAFFMVNGVVSLLLGLAGIIDCLLHPGGIA